MLSIDKCSATMHELKEKFNNNPFVTQEFFEEYEYALLDFANCLATETVSVNYEKIKLDEAYTKRFAEIRAETKTNADAESKCDLEFIDRKTKRKSLENTNKMYENLVWNYRRFGDMLKGSIIGQRQDNKRTDTLLSGELPF